MSTAGRVARVSMPLLGAVCLVAVGAGPALADDETATITVTGQATVTKPPDRAHIDIGVVTQAPKAEAAASENARRLAAVRKAMLGVLGDDAELQTVAYSVNPDYRYPERGGERKLVGYIATNVLRARTDDLDRVGPVIDAALAAGANRVQSLRFLLRDEETVRSQALAEASAQARRKAEAIAKGLDLRVERVLRVEEGGAPIRPLQAERVMASAAAATPVEPGQIEVRATVSLTVEVKR